MIEYEYAFVNLSSSRRDEDLNSEFDKYESYQMKADEGIVILNAAACKDAMAQIEMQFDPISEDEIRYYKKRLSDGCRCSVQPFQKDLLFSLFVKYFGDFQVMNDINLDDYIKLIIIAKRILIRSGMRMLSHIISSKIIRLASRKSINKKEMTKLEMSPLWKVVQEKYKSEKIEKYILGIIAQILCSDFEVIDYDDDYIDGRKIDMVPEIICEEVLQFVCCV